MNSFNKNYINSKLFEEFFICYFLTTLSIFCIGILFFKIAFYLANTNEIYKISYNIIIYSKTLMFIAKSFFILSIFLIINLFKEILIYKNKKITFTKRIYQYFKPIDRTMFPATSIYIIFSVWISIAEVINFNVINVIEWLIPVYLFPFIIMLLPIFYKKYGNNQKIKLPIKEST